MKTKSLLVLLLIMAVTSVSAQGKSKFAPQLDKILEMFIKKDAKVAASVLHKDYTIAGIFPGAEEQVLPQLFEQFPKLDGYTIVSEKQEAKGTRIVINFTEKKSGFEYPSNFLIDKNGIVTELNLLDNAKIETKFN